MTAQVQTGQVTYPKLCSYKLIATAPVLHPFSYPRPPFSYLRPLQGDCAALPTARRNLGLPSPTALAPGLGQKACLTNSGRNAYTSVSSLCIRCSTPLGSLPCFPTFDNKYCWAGLREDEHSPVNSAAPARPRPVRVQPRSAELPSRTAIDQAVECAVPRPTHLSRTKTTQRLTSKHTCFHPTVCPEVLWLSVLKHH